jgi:hypothetical protein
MWVLSLAVVLSAMSAASFAQPGGGGGGFRMPMVFGTVQVVGDNATTFAVKPAFGPPDQPLVMVNAGANVKLLEIVDVDVATLKPGDQISVAGVPLKMRGDSVQVGGDFGQIMMQAFGGEPGGGPGGGPGGAQGRGGPGGPQLTANLTSGTVVTAQPLVVEIMGLQITVEVAKDAQVIKFQPLADATTVKANSKIIGVGQRTDNNIAATLILLDSSANGYNPMRGMGMLGGRGGRGGPGGGPGGPPPAAPPAAPLAPPAPK